jgi:hypothetical protein
MPHSTSFSAEASIEAESAIGDPSLCPTVSVSEASLAGSNWSSAG